MMHDRQKSIRHTVSRTIRYSSLALLLLLDLPSVLQAASPVAPAATTSESTPQEVTLEKEHVTVSLNHASAEQLASQLKGVGRKRAQAIVHYRETHGPFVSLEQLTEVPGISSSVLEQNRQRLTL